MSRIYVYTPAAQHHRTLAGTYSHLAEGIGG